MIPHGNKHQKIVQLVLLVGLAIGMTACSKSTQDANQSAPITPTASTAVLNGAGASFPFPLYARWASDYEKQTGVRINYQSIGSGGGIAQIKAKTVDFGASDAPLTKAELDAAGLVQWPMTAGGVVLVVNLQGVGPDALKLSRELLARIFLGEVKTWQDPAILALNPGLALPDKNITVVHRSDGSGTTWIFTNYLDKISPAWHEKVGTGKDVAWPAGVGGKGNEGVTAYVQRIEGSIGYVEYAYAIQNKLSSIQLENRAGGYVKASLSSFQAAAQIDWTANPGMYAVLTDQEGETAWPIAGASFILMHREQTDVAKAKALLSFFAWCFQKGQQSAGELHYVPMPQPVVETVEALWRTDLRAGGQALWP